VVLTTVTQAIVISIPDERVMVTVMHDHIIYMTDLVFWDRKIILGGTSRTYMGPCSAWPSAPAFMFEMTPYAQNAPKPSVAIIFLSTFGMPKVAQNGFALPSPAERLNQHWSR